MSDLAEQILAAIGRVEDLALRTPPGPWHPNAEHDEVLAVDDIVVCDGFALSNRQLRATVDHIVMHDPRSVGRRCAADREIVALYVDAKRISTNGWRKANAGGRITDAEAQEVMQADNELDVLDTVLEILARGYRIQPTPGGDHA